MHDLTLVKRQADAVDYHFSEEDWRLWKLKAETAIADAFGDNSRFAVSLRSLTWPGSARSPVTLVGNAHAADFRSEIRAIIDEAFEQLDASDQRVSKTLYLFLSTAKTVYLCAGCGAVISRRAPYYRHVPHPSARFYRGETASHWCVPCVEASGAEPDKVTRAYRVPTVRVLDAAANRLSSRRVIPVRVELIGIGEALTQHLAGDPSLIHSLRPDQFEEFICDRLSTMGFEPLRTRSTHAKDGGIDILFWPRNADAFPILGAAQVKHHRDPKHTVGSPIVREFAGSLAGHNFSAALLVTNTSFTPDARWAAEQHAPLLRLRDFEDIRRWLANNFASAAEWREIPRAIELCPGVVIPLR